jgi:hypothetical protein
MRRVIIFAHYDKHNIIDPYVISYLEELRKYSEIIFVSDGDLSRQEISKVKDLCFDNICKKHGESNDFGSYKKGFILLKDKYSKKFNALDEVLFVNDSCYLIQPFEKVFFQMEKKEDVDFWGLTDNYTDLRNIRYHIQSYFIGFRRNIFLDKDFQEFIANITKQKGKTKIIDIYEIGLSEFLIAKGYKTFAIFGYSQMIKFLSDNMINIANEIKGIICQNSYFNKKSSHKIVKNIFSIYEGDYILSDKIFFLIKNKFPLIKRLTLQKSYSPKETMLFLWEIMLKNINVKMIKQINNHNKRIGLKIKSRKTLSSIFHYIYYRVSIMNYFYVKKRNNKSTIIKILFFKFKINDY